MFRLLLYIPPIIFMLTSMGKTPGRIANDGNYQCYQTKDSSIIEVLDYGKTALVVQTVCAPVCCSHAHIYDTKKNTVIREVKPTVDGVFPYAWIEDGTLHWRDNTVEILDDQEKKDYNH